jgi:hypothetical protein
MRSNSGRDESRNNLRDPTLRDRQNKRGSSTAAGEKSNAPADHRTGRKD